MNVGFLSNEKFITKKDLLFFKEDVLKEFRITENDIKTKYNKNLNNLETKLNDYIKKQNNLNEKINEILRLISTENNSKEKIENLLIFKNNIENKILTNEIQLNNLNKEFSNSVLKYDKILSDSVIYPGFIGNLCKFKTFHDYMDYCLLNIKDLNTFKNKNNIDLKDYKNQLNSMINFFKSQINNILFNANKFTKEAISNSEITFNENFEKLKKKYNEIQIENSQYYNDLIEKSNLLKNEKEKLIDFKAEIFTNFQENIEKIKKENLKVLEKFKGYKEEFILIKSRFSQLSEFIKDVRFKSNINKPINKNDIDNISKKIDFQKKQKINMKEKDYLENTNLFLTNEENNNHKILNSYVYYSDNNLINISKENYDMKNIKNNSKNILENKSFDGFSSEEYKESNINNKIIENNISNNNNKTDLKINEQDVIKNVNKNNKLYLKKSNSTNDINSTNYIENKKNNNNSLEKGYLIKLYNIMENDEIKKILKNNNLNNLNNNKNINYNQNILNKNKSSDYMRYNNLELNQEKKINEKNMNIEDKTLNSSYFPALNNNKEEKESSILKRNVIINLKKNKQMINFSEQKNNELTKYYNNNKFLNIKKNKKKRLNSAILKANNLDSFQSHSTKNIMDANKFQKLYSNLKQVANSNDKNKNENNENLKNYNSHNINNIYNLYNQNKNKKNICFSTKYSFYKNKKEISNSFDNN